MDKIKVPYYCGDRVREALDALLRHPAISNPDEALQDRIFALMQAVRLDTFDYVGGYK